MFEVDIFKVSLFQISTFDGCPVVIFKILNDKNHTEKFLLKLLIAQEVKLKEQMYLSSRILNIYSLYLIYSKQFFKV